MITMWRNALSQRDREDGFSLVELIVAMIVIAVVLMLLIGVQISSIATVTEARKLQQATALANESMEQMRAMPWQVLSKGMYSNFLVASGGDDLVSGEYLQLDGAPMRILIAPSENDQDLSEPWLPLFDDEGKHKQIRQDPSLAGVDFTVKAYVIEGIDSAETGTLGIAVVVEWIDKNGEIRSTFVRSTVHQSGCGAPGTTPFLASCQDFYEANSGSGSIVLGLSATTAADVDPASVPLTDPSPHNVFGVTVNGASAASALKSQQVNLVDGFLQYGGHQADDDDIESLPLVLRGGEIHQLRASDDATNEGGWVANPADLNVSQSSTIESQSTVAYPSAPSGEPRFRIRSDYARPGTVKASTLGGCATGIPADQPCSIADLRNNSDPDAGSPYMVMDMAGELFRLARPMVEIGGSSSTDDAWTARFASAPGTAERGCETLVGSGCISAGSARTIAELHVGEIVGTDWDGDATDGVVILRGGGSCSNYSDSVMVQRGPGQLVAAPVLNRCGTVRYWTDSGYSDYALSDTSNETLNTEPVTWTDGTYTVTATAQVRIVPGYQEVTGSDDCATTSCSVSASAGSITIETEYTLEWGSHSHVLTATADIKSPTARASYTAGVGE
jgi:prepilin-type N-terminal cleavage/methylation domain-containing protein